MRSSFSSGMEIARQTVSISKPMLKSTHKNIKIKNSHISNFHPPSMCTNIKLEGKHQFEGEKGVHDPYPLE